MLLRIWRRRWLWPVPAVFTLLLCVAIGPRLGGRPVRAQTADDQSLLLQLAERLLSSQLPPVVSSAGASVQLFPGALAGDFPADVPLPPGSTLIGSDERPSFSTPPPFIGNNGYAGPQAASSTPSGVHIDVVLDTPGSVAAVTSFYQSALTDAGWTLPATAGFGPSGFLSSALPVQPTNYCRPDDHAQLSISTRPGNGGPLDVRLGFDTGFNPQCNPTATPPATLPVPFAPLGVGAVPALLPPQGVHVVNVGGSSFGPNRYGTDAVAVTDMSVTALHRFYAGGLSDAGWTQISSGGDASLTWSTWSIPDHPDLQGFLYVRNGPADGQRSLHLEMGSTDPNAALSPPFYPSAGVVTTFPSAAPAAPMPTATPTP